VPFLLDLLANLDGKALAVSGGSIFTLGSTLLGVLVLEVGRGKWSSFYV
jgi:hypothetical protein